MNSLNQRIAPGFVKPSNPFIKFALWGRDDNSLSGQGGWTVLITGPERLVRLAEVWRRIIRVVQPTNDEKVTCFVSSVFDERSLTPSVLHIPKQLRHSQGATVRKTDQVFTREQLESALHGLEDVRLLGEKDFSLLDGPRECISQQQYEQNVRTVLSSLEDGELSKVVLCRDEVLTGSDERWNAALIALRRQYPECWTFAVGGLFGSTPELLASKSGDQVLSRVLAGSLPRTKDRTDAGKPSRLMKEERFRAEHDHAAVSVIQGLEGVIELDNGKPDPFVLELPNIYHLATDVEGTSSDPDMTVLDLVDCIHPTAAVGGVPRAEALQVIAEVEQRDRGRFAGPVGWMDSTGDGEIGLALRCGQVEGEHVRIFAGGGIVAGSVPQEEVAETVSKMQPMHSALGIES